MYKYLSPTISKLPILTKLTDAVKPSEKLARKSVGIIEIIYNYHFAREFVRTAIYSNNKYSLFFRNNVAF